MAEPDEWMEGLRRKYGAYGIDNGLRLHPDRFADMLERRDALDPHYAKLWLDFICAGMPRCLSAAAILERILEEQGRMAELTDTQLPLPR